MQVYIDAFTNKVSPNGIYSINLPDSFSLSKKIVGEDGEIKTVAFTENPYIFTAEEVAQAKFEQIASDYGFVNAYADEFVSEEDINILAEGHSANTGVKVLELLPNGQCQTNTLAIGENAKTFTLYLEADSNVAVSISGDDGANFSLFENNVAVLRELSSEVILKFEETSGKKANINAYCIMFN